LLFNIALSLLMLWGMIWLARRRSTYTVPLAVFPLIYPWAYYLTLALPRYRFPIDPIIVLLAGVGALALARSSGRNAAQPAPATHLA
jgi:hypothetical protein